MKKRFFDVAISILLLMITFPLWLLLMVVIPIDSTGYPFFFQERTGRWGKLFTIYKFRTMRRGSRGSLLTSFSDVRITRIGKVLRRYHLDELPQLLNVLRGEMSLVGPRPEVPEYTRLYSGKQKEVLSVRPGITNYASIVFANEQEHLARFSNPEEGYIHEIMPRKIMLNLKYIREQSFVQDIRILLRTVNKIRGK